VFDLPAYLINFNARTREERYKELDSTFQVWRLLVLEDHGFNYACQILDICICVFSLI
jgi:hypothetical protein